MDNHSFTQKVGQNNIVYTKIGKGEPLLFLHGFALSPKIHSKLFENLKEEYEIIAPKLYGTPYLKNHPSTLEDLLTITNEFTNTIKLGKHHLAGYSTGGGIAYMYATNSKDPTDIIGLNPIFPTGYKPLEFVKRFIKGGFSENALTESKKLTDYIIKTKDNIQMSTECTKNTLKNMTKSYELMKSIGEFSFDNIKIDQPSLLIYSDKDEFFEMDKITKKGIKKAFTNLTKKELKGYGHKWLVFYPKMAAEEIRSFHKSI